MPDADTVWLTPLDEMLALLERAGLVVRWQEDCSRSHRAMADSLIDAFAADAAAIAAQIGRRGAGGAAGRAPALERLAGDGRVRKFAFVAEKPARVASPHVRRAGAAAADRSTRRTTT